MEREGARGEFGRFGVVMEVISNQCLSNQSRRRQSQHEGKN